MPNEAILPAEDRLIEPSLKVPRTERNPKGGGSLPHGVVEAGVQRRIDVTAATAMDIIRKHVEFKRKSYRKLPSDLQRACEYVIDHAIGKARQKIEHSGGILTYGNLAKEAEKIAAKPRDVLADAEEIATKRQRLADLADPETARRRAGLERMLARADELPDVEPEPVAELPPDNAGLISSPTAEGSDSTTQDGKPDEPGQ